MTEKRGTEGREGRQRSGKQITACSATGKRASDESKGRNPLTGSLIWGALLSQAEGGGKKYPKSTLSQNTKVRPQGRKGATIKRKKMEKGKLIMN